MARTSLVYYLLIVGLAYLATVFANEDVLEKRQLVDPTMMAMAK
jgi:hypothetical protein